MISDYCEFDEESMTLAFLEARRRRKQDPPWFARIQGNVVKLYRQGCEKPPHVKEKRKPIGPWSYQSRMNLLKRLNVIDYRYVGPSVFVTLTYPDEIDKMPYKKRSLHRGAFAQMVERALGRHVPMVWRIEWEERKSGRYTGKIAPHFHLMVFGIGDISKSQVRAWWRRAIHRESGPLVVDSRPIYNEDGALRYLAKYVSKYVPLDLSAYHNSGIEFGRHWGILRPECLPLCPVTVQRSLSKEEIKFVRGFGASKWKHYDQETGGGFTLLGPAYVKLFSDWLNSSGQKGT